MPSVPRCFRSVLIAACAVACLLPGARSRAAVGWRPVTPAELGLKAPVVEAGADAEALFYEIEVEDERQHDRSIRRHYIRIKVFTESGKQSLAQVDLRCSDRFNVTYVEARTIQPDGTVVELKKEDLHERYIVRGRRGKVRVTSFPLPAVTPGAIVEYRWTEIADGIHQFASIPLQREVPIQRLRLAVRPWESAWSAYRMGWQGFHVTLSPPAEERQIDGRVFTVLTANNLPAYKEEPDMPPEKAVRAWVQLYYLTNPSESPERFWERYGSELAQELGGRLKPGEALRAALPGIVGDAASSEQRLARICEFCRTQIKRLDDDASGTTADERERSEGRDSAAETLKRRAGTDRDVATLFGALAAADGRDVRLINLPDRSEFLFLPAHRTPRLLKDLAIAVRLGKGWQFFDPSKAYADCGHLRWQNEGVTGLILDGKKPEFVAVPLSSADYSRVERSGRLRLSEDGTLEGDVRLTYTGHLGAEQKEANDAETAERRAERVREGLKTRLGQAQVERIEIQNASDALAPLTILYHVRVPGYAQRTGKRLLLQPSFFHYGSTPRYTASARAYDLAFDYAWSEVDTLEIELPDGYELDHADAPAPIVVPPDLSLTVGLRVGTGARQVLYLDRRFSFGSGNRLLFARASYAGLKQIFDDISQIDNHVIALRQKAGGD